MYYETINQMYHREGLDMDHWINAEHKQFKKNNSLDRADPKLNFIPPEILEIEYTCHKGHKFKPNLLAKTWPQQPFISPDGGLFQAESSLINCTVCGEEVRVNYKNKNMGAVAKLYGDEAFREYEKYKAVIYAFVSKPLKAKEHKEFVNGFLSIKKKLLPNRKPDTWVFHCKELWSGSKRAQNPLFQNLTKEDVISATKEICLHAQKYYGEQGMNVYCSTGVHIHDDKNAKATEIQSKSMVYYAALERVIFEATRGGIAPRFYFEKTGKDGWAHDLFYSGRCTHMWPLLTHGLPVGSPKFINPEQSIYLEYADIVCFISTLR